MKTTSKYLTLMSVILSGFTAAAQPQVILLETFDPLPGDPPATWSGGNLANVSVAYVAGAGVGGSGAGVIAADYQSQWDGYVALQYGNGNLNGATSPNLADYTLSFDMNVTGVALNQLQLNIQAWPNNWWDGSMTQSGAAAISVSPVTGWQEVSINLGDTDLWANSGLNPQLGTIQLQFQVNGWQLVDGGPSIGQEVAFDNIRLEMIPEPSAAALLAVGVLIIGIVARRKRRNG